MITDDDDRVVVDISQVSPVMGTIVVVCGMILVLGVLWLFAYSILQGSLRPSPVALVVALAMLTFLALVGAITTGAAAMETIAAAGIGALASAVSQQFVAKEREDDELD